MQFTFSSMLREGEGHTFDSIDVGTGFRFHFGGGMHVKLTDLLAWDLCKDKVMNDIKSNQAVTDLYVTTIRFHPALKTVSGDKADGSTLEGGA